MALWHVRQYDIFDSQVLVQVVYSRTKEASVLIFPVQEEGTKIQSHADWEIKVTFPLDRSQPKVTTRGKVRVATAEKSGLGDAVVAAMDTLSQEGMLSRVIPTCLRAHKGPDNYRVFFSSLERTVGDHFTVRLSTDLEQVRIIPGK
jgi:hypothetical protein